MPAVPVGSASEDRRSSTPELTAPDVPKADPSRFSFPHLAIRVRDLGASLFFYENVFGFEASPRRIATGLSGLLGDIEACEVQFVRHPCGPAIELLRPLGADGVRLPYETPLGFLGPTHLCCVVQDLEETIAAVISYGGRVIEESRTTLESGNHLAFVTDPDGTRIELVQRQSPA